MDHRTPESIDNSSIAIRPFQLSDDVGAITRLLHAAYKPLGDMGLRYMATHQNDQITRDRLMNGESWLAVDVARIVGTITLYEPSESSDAEYYRLPGTYHFGQYGVDPAYQRFGIGRKLLNHVENYARTIGAIELALDTAQPAKHLIALYIRYGYEMVSEVSWPDVNYRSVIMSKKL